MKDRQFMAMVGLVVAAGLVMGLIAFRMTGGSPAVETAAAKAIGGDPNAPRPSAADAEVDAQLETPAPASDTGSQNGEPLHPPRTRPKCRVRQTAIRQAPPPNRSSPARQPKHPATRPRNRDARGRQARMGHRDRRGAHNSGGRRGPRFARFSFRPAKAHSVAADGHDQDRAFAPARADCTSATDSHARANAGHDDAPPDASLGANPSARSRPGHRHYDQFVVTARTCDNLKQLRY